MKRLDELDMAAINARFSRNFEFMKDETSYMKNRITVNGKDIMYHMGERLFAYRMCTKKQELPVDEPVRFSMNPQYRK